MIDKSTTFSGIKNALRIFCAGRLSNLTRISLKYALLEGGAG